MFSMERPIEIINDNEARMIEAGRDILAQAVPYIKEIYRTGLAYSEFLPQNENF